ncbi:MAG: ROK family protein [Gammaproteobacteria bacterium]
MIKNIISWDIGGTKCAAGVVEYDQNTQEFTCRQRFSINIEETSSLEDLIRQLEKGLAFSMPAADAICIGAAGQYNGESLIYEGVYPYPMHFAKVAKNQNWPLYAVVHDYTPIVCATFTSYMDNAQNIKQLNSAPFNHYGRRVALGLGTGLGMKDGALLSSGDVWLGKNEIGHIGITAPPHADSERQKQHAELISFLQANHQPVTFEKILSGPGMTRLYEFFYPNQEKLTPEQVSEKIREGLATEMYSAFAWYLGILIGTIQLIFMPEGGIWITGGVALKHLPLFDSPDFLAGIKASPAYQTQREEYPLGVLCNPEHALIGGGYYAVNQLMTAFKH